MWLIHSIGNFFSEFVYVKVDGAFIPEIMVGSQMRYRFEEFLEVSAPVLKIYWTLWVIN